MQWRHVILFFTAELIRKRHSKALSELFWLDSQFFFLSQGFAIAAGCYLTTKACNPFDIKTKDNQTWQSKKVKTNFLEIP